jgi:hypothetical protein
MLYMFAFIKIQLGCVPRTLTRKSCSEKFLGQRLPKKDKTIRRTYNKLDTAISYQNASVVARLSTSQGISESTHLSATRARHSHAALTQTTQRRKSTTERFPNKRKKYTYNTTRSTAIAPPLPMTTAAAAGAASPALTCDGDSACGNVGNRGWIKNSVSRSDTTFYLGIEGGCALTYIGLEGPSCESETAGEGERDGEPNA